MGNGNRKGGGGGDMVVESRHLVGLFLGVVLLCGVFFTLGYVMGRSQNESSVRAAAPSKEKGPAPTPAAAQDKTAPGVPGPSEWDFYKTSETSKPAERPQPSASPSSSSAQPSAPTETVSKGAPAKNKAPLSPPLIPRGAVVLQLAALTRQSDALALAEALQQKKYPAFVLMPTSDNLYRIQVGPYADRQSAEIARRSLEREGFKAIIKR